MIFCFQNPKLYFQAYIYLKKFIQYFNMQTRTTILFLCLAIFCESQLLKHKLVGSFLQGNWKTSDSWLHPCILCVPPNEMINKANTIAIPFFMPHNSKIRQKQLKGESDIQFYYEGMETETPMVNYVFIRLYDEKYINQKVIELNINLGKGFNSTTNSWHIKDSYTGIILYENFQPLVKMDIKLQELKIEEVDSTIKLVLDSASLKIDIDGHYSTFGYSMFIFVTLLNLIQLSLIFCYYNQRNRTILYNTSEWLLLHGCCFMLAEALMLFNIGVSYYNTPLGWLLINAILNVVIMLLFLRKFEAVLDKFKNKINLIIGIGFVLVYFVLCYWGYQSHGFWVLESMVFLWQVMHGMLYGVMGGVSFDLIAVVLGSRFLLWHFLVSQDNVLRIQPSHHTFLVIFVLTVVHLLLVGLQGKYGGRFMIPNSIIPGYYDYYKSAMSHDQIAKSQCSICLNQLREKPEAISKNTQQTQNLEEIKKEESLEETEENKQGGTEQNIEEEGVQKIWYALSPCNHAFHPKCLQDWLNQKLTCPLCRITLPPLNPSNH